MEPANGALVDALRTALEEHVTPLVHKRGFRGPKWDVKAGANLWARAAYSATHLEIAWTMSEYEASIECHIAPSSKRRFGLFRQRSPHPERRVNLEHYGANDARPLVRSPIPSESPPAVAGPNWQPITPEVVRQAIARHARLLESLGEAILADERKVLDDE